MAMVVGGGGAAHTEKQFNLKCTHNEWLFYGTDTRIACR